MTDLPPSLAWAQRLQALAQTGLTFGQDPFDVERYEKIRQIAAEMAAAAEPKANVAWLVEDFTLETGYATPKVDVRGAAFDLEGRILLVRERSDGKWTLPGGWADVGASPAENIEREIFEEAGFRAKAVRLLAVYDRSRHDHPPMFHAVYKMFFLCELTGGEAAIGGTSETDGVEFFALNALPPLSVARVTAGQMHRLAELARQPQAPADFD